MNSGQPADPRPGPCCCAHLAPIVLILVAAACLSFAMGDATGGFIILVIVGASSLLGFLQEFRAASALQGLQKMVWLKVEVWRDGQAVTVPVNHFVLHASPALFWRSRPSTALTLAIGLVVCATIALPYTALGAVFGLKPLPALFMAWMGAIVLCYIASAEGLKRSFYRVHWPQT